MEENYSEDAVRDVVCGMTKPKEKMKFKSVYKSDTYYFCSKMDKEIFDAHPENWLKKVGDF